MSLRQERAVSHPSARASSVDRRFVGAGLALVVDPGDASILSPFLAPLNLNCRYGFFDTAGPHSALSTGLPLWRHGHRLDEPCAGTRRRPNRGAGRSPSHGSSTRARRRRLACSVARMRIGSGIAISSNSLMIGVRGSAAAAAERDLDFLGGDVELVVGLHHRVDVRGLTHLDAGRDVGFGAGRNAEAAPPGCWGSSRPGCRPPACSGSCWSQPTGTTAPFSAMSGAVIAMSSLCAAAAAAQRLDRVVERSWSRTPPCSTPAAAPALARR